MLAFIYATPLELGFDPNIKGCTPQGGSQYFVYTVKNDTEGTAYFRTLESLSEYRSLNISGRATRVWRAIQIKSLDDHSPVNGANVVLKDIWLQQDAKTERQLQTELFTDITTFSKQIPPRWPYVPVAIPTSGTLEGPIQDILADEKWKRHFLTIKFDAIGASCKKCSISAKADLTLFRPPFTPQKAPRSPASDSSRVYSSASALREQSSSTSQSPVVPRKFAPKRRYIVVFEELCKAVEELTSFSDTMNALKDSVKGYIGHFLTSFVLLINA